MINRIFIFNFFIYNQSELRIHLGEPKFGDWGIRNFFFIVALLKRNVKDSDLCNLIHNILAQE